MQLRVDNTIKIDLSFPERYDNVDLPPLLFISFIENAFKHGVSYREPSRLSFTLTQNQGSIEFLAVNTISAHNASELPAGGIGLENIRKRLDLLYRDKYLLDISQTGEQFCVRLVVPSSTK
jgi:sensor histidine kinase YesM